jgi:very-short-patch-repair endonuclease
LWGLLATSGTRIDVTAVRSNSKNRPRITLHRARRLHVDDRASVDGIPVTSIPRTLLDLAEVVSWRQLERAVEEAERSGRFDLRATERLIARSQGRHGLPVLLAVISGYREPPVTRSELERVFLDLCREAGLPSPAVNAFVAGFEVDAVWYGRRLVVELDGHNSHGTRAAFERDRVRDAALQLEGYRVVRVTYRRLAAEPAEVIATVRGLLDLDG